MLTALPLYAIFQGDKILVANLLSIEALAVYSAAFTLSMIAANTCTRIMTLVYLPILARLQDDRKGFTENYLVCNQLSTLLATLFSFGFIVFGGVAMALAFGPNYEGHFQLAALCGIMWGVRMLSIAPTVALLAIGNSRATLLPSVLRASVLIPTYFILESTQNLNSIVILGAIGEGIALCTIYFSAAKAGYGNKQILTSWAFFYCLVVGSVFVFYETYEAVSSAFLFVASLFGFLGITLLYLLLFPGLIKRLRDQLFTQTLRNSEDQ
jgi:O-antigen/teichoic acid export membrane protein